MWRIRNRRVSDLDIVNEERSSTYGSEGEENRSRDGGNDPRSCTEKMNKTPRTGEMHSSAWFSRQRHCLTNGDGVCVHYRSPLPLKKRLVAFQVSHSAMPDDFDQSSPLMTIQRVAKEKNWLAMGLSLYHTLSCIKAALTGTHPGANEHCAAGNDLERASLARVHRRGLRVVFWYN
ncbi:hypothetical protein EK21DRAFT_90475 [Setomelanomma holmii]|uniref:Uncharacterized protein n=1 Tax=Setomelanomma holmii TaxID=210430 RepID=A0A9P4LKF9_9PLEO|nr:hypothetical protein EK21DRAFT_90475 [Setomelanomma holmii]